MNANRSHNGFHRFHLPVDLSFATSRRTRRPKAETLPFIGSAQDHDSHLILSTSLPTPDQLQTTLSRLNCTYQRIRSRSRTPSSFLPPSAQWSTCSTFSCTSFYILPVIFAVSATILPIALIFGITMPFTGVLVRYRANYTPKRGLRLGSEDEMDVTSSETDSFFGMMKRVHRIEGWAGLYKGIMPFVIATLITIVAILPIALFLAVGHKVLPTQSAIVPWIISCTISLVPVTLLIPMQIISNRAITTLHRLDALAPKAALQVLLSPAERAQPLRLFLAPGVALSEVLRGLVFPTLIILVQFIPSHRLPILIATLPLIALATVLLTPLQVMGTRLTLQRLGDTPETSLDAPPPGYGVEEVMEFRTQHAPYTSLFDCGKQMVVEEGWCTLLRAWWITPLWIMLFIMANFITERVWVIWISKF